MRYLKLLSFYTLALKAQIDIFWWIIFTFSGYYFIFKKNPGTKYALLAYWLIVPYFLFSFLIHDIRHTLPYLPAIAVLSASWIIKNWRALWIKILSCSLIGPAIAHFFLLTFGPINYVGFPQEKNALRRIFLPSCPLLWICHPIDKTDWKIREILGCIADNAVYVYKRRR
ncbi:MAG: hypothetical protein LHV69_11685 [Elusimicrobia bacterium]|nr:hypothetical protein [Candidatus Obscuribacterium magneticum]